MTDTVQPASSRSLVQLKIYNFFVYGSIAVLFAFFPFYFMKAGLSRMEIGMLMAGGPFVSIIANPMWGYLSDRFQNLRRVIVILLLGNLLAVQAVFHTTSFGVIYLVMIVFFFFQTPLFSQSNSLILNTIEGTRYKFGTFRLWGSLGWALLAVAVGPVIERTGIDRLWIIYSVMLLITLAFTIGLPRGQVAEVPTKFDGRGYGKVFINPHFTIFVLLGVLISVPNSMNSTFVSIYISDLGGSETLIGWSAFFSAIFEIPVFLLFDRFLKKKTNTMVACLAAVSLLFALRWLLMAVAAGPWQIIWIQVLHCITFGGYYYVGTSLTAHLIPSEYRATGQAAFALTWGGISGILAGFIGGWMFQNLGPAPMYTISAVVSLLGAAGFVWLWRMIRKAEARTSGTHSAAV